MTSVKRMLPPIDELNRPFWTSGASGALHLPRCTSCRRWAIPPAPSCSACGEPTGYEPVSGRGRVFTFTVNHHPFNPDVPVPYVVAIVELEEQDGLRFTTNVVNCAPEDVRIDMPLSMVFERQGDVFVPQFEPA